MTSIIAEFCQNHRGDRALLADMVAAAAEAGASHAKIQAIWARDLSRRERFEEGLVEDGVTKVIRRPYQPEYDRLKGLELPEETVPWFVEECERRGIRPLISVFTRGQVPWVAKFPWREIKVGSADCASVPLLHDLADRFDHLYVSTGMAFDEEIEATAEALRRRSFTFLHCVSLYPTPIEQVHLSRMQWLRRFTESVGFSDHTLVERDGVKASMSAIALGASVVERHFTLLPTDATRDGPVSIGPRDLEGLCAFARLSAHERLAALAEAVPGWEVMLGTPHRELTHDELLNRDYYRGRFATRVGDRWIYNWEDESL